MARKPNEKPCDSVVLAWTRLVRAEQAVLGAVERDLKEAGFPPLAWYDVLLELVRAADGRLRPYELEQKTLLAQYNLSRLLDRLEREGLIRRQTCPDDARGQWVVVTDRGRALQEKMWKAYAPAIQRHVGDRLDEKQAATLGELLGRLLN